MAAESVDWTTALRRAPLLPLAAALALLLPARGGDGARAPALEPERPVTAEVAVPVLGAAAWQRDDDGWTARARVRSVEQAGRRVVGPERVWLRLRGEGAPPAERRLRVRGYFSRRPAYRNLHVSRPGEWGFNVKSRQLIEAAGNPPGRGLRLLAGLRQRLLRPVDEAEGPGALMARALVFGDARRTPPEWRTGLRRAGLSHLLAVSGLHVGLLLGGFWWVFGARSGRFVGAGAVLVLLFYGCLVGPRPSFVRAAIMALLVVLAMALERPPQALNSLCAAAILILALDPAAGGDLGFQLSFLATAGILVLAPRLLNRWRGDAAAGPPNPVAAALAATVAAQLATMPVTAVEIGVLTPLSPLLNLAFVPLTALVLGCALVWVALAALASTPVLGLAAWPCARAVQALLDLLSLPFASLAHLPAGSWLALPVSVDGAAALGLALWLGVLASGFRRAVWGVALVLVCTPALPDDEPGLTMLDVGQGEAMLLRSGERGPVVLVDGGGFRRGNFAEAALLQALAAEGVHRIDLAVLSHGDTDHCQGLLDLSRYLRIERLWAAPVEIRDGCGRALADRLGARVRKVERGFAERVGAWNLEILHPGPGRKEGGNSASLVMRACVERVGRAPAEVRRHSSEIGGSCVLLTGDLDLAGERELLARGRGGGAPVRSDVLKVGHHGSRTSTGAALLAAVAPRLALVSAGRRNPYGHPSPEVLARLERRGVRVLRTDLHGRIEVRFRDDGAGGRRPVLQVAPGGPGGLPVPSNVAGRGYPARMSSPSWQAIAVLGPTATGKSAFAMALAADLAARGRRVELISADALQAYRGLTIGTAKPGPRARTCVRHHLVDILEPHQTFSAGEFARRAAAAVAEIEARGALPVLVGGSGFYLRALFEGLAPVPPVGAEVREAVRADLRSRGLCSLVEELRRLDPEGAANLAQGDTQRVLRALEVARATGRPLSAWQRQETERRLDRRVLKIGLTLPRAVLYDAVEKRARRMLERGWLVEVEGLREAARARGGCSRGELPAFKAIGYRQLADHLDGKLTLEQALEETVRATRRYAKRQETWFRKEPRVHWIDASKAGETERAWKRIVEALVGGRPFEAAP